MKLSTLIILFTIWYSENGLEFGENDIWKCTIIDRPLRFWNIPRTSMMIVNPVKRNLRVTEVFKSQNVFLYGYEWDGKCYHQITDVNTGYKELVFVAPKPQREQVVIVTKNWMPMSLRPNGKCDWNMELDPTCHLKTPLRCIINCNKQLEGWTATKCVFLDVLSPVIIKPGPHVAIIKLTHQEGTVKSIPVTILGPQERTQEMQIPCEVPRQSAQISTHQSSPFCQLEDIDQMVGYGCVGSFKINATKSGMWVIQGPYGVKYQLNLTVAHPPVTKFMGPYVIKRDVSRMVLVEPKYSVKHINIPLHLSTVGINPKCRAFVGPMLVGWNKWVQVMNTSPIHSRGRRAKRDGIAKIMGGIGSSLGLITTANQLNMARRMSTLSTSLSDMTHPLNKALLSLNKIQLDVTKVLPVWLDIQEQDHRTIIGVIGSLQANLSLAITCVQIQAVLIDLAKDIIRDSLSGKVPVEITNLLEGHVNDFERTHTEWWSVLDSQYNPEQDVLQLVILTIHEAIEERIYPIIPLGLFLNHTIMLPIHDRVWAYFQDDNIQTVNLQACVEQKGLGYTCTTGLWEETHLCLNSEEGECHYDLHPSTTEVNHSVIVQTSEGCMCVRSLCPTFTVNHFYIVNASVKANLCICGVFHVQGCDVKLSLFEPSHEDITIDIRMVRIIEPIHIGPDLNIVQSLLHHEKLIGMVKEVEDTGSKLGIVIQHTVQGIKNIGKAIQENSQAKWWEIDLSNISVSSFLSHPLILCIIIQGYLILHVYILTCCICKKSQDVHQYKFNLPTPEV